MMIEIKLMSSHVMVQRAPSVHLCPYRKCEKQNDRFGRNKELKSNDRKRKTKLPALDTSTVVYCPISLLKLTSEEEEKMREKDMTPQASTLTPITRAACIFET
jgi:hypothetical protein